MIAVSSMTTFEHGGMCLIVSISEDDEKELFAVTRGQSSVVSPQVISVPSMPRQIVASRPAKLKTHCTLDPSNYLASCKAERISLC